MAITAAIRQWSQILLTELAVVIGEIIRFIPGFVVAVLAVVVAWIAGRILERLTVLVLEGIKFDEMLARGPVDFTSLEVAEAKAPPTRIIAALVSWATFFFLGLAPAADILGLTVARVLVERIIDFVPTVLAALLVMGAAILIGVLLRELIRSVLATSNLPFGRESGWVAYALVVMFGLGLALQVLHISTSVSTAILGAVGATVGLAVAIGFGVGTRGVFGAVAAGRELRDRFSEGDEVMVENYTGTVERFGLDAVQLRTPQGLVSIPNYIFMHKIVVKKSLPPRRAA